MSIEQYFTKLPRDAPLPISWKPPAPKRPKRGPGRPRKNCPPVTVMIDDSDKENDPDDSQGTEKSLESENDPDNSQGTEKSLESCEMMSLK